MSLAKSSADYPRELVDFALGLADVGPGWRAAMRMVDSRAAQHWRMLFYGFRKACERDNPKLAEWMRPISVAIRGTTIELSHRDGMPLMDNMHELFSALPAQLALPEPAPAPKRESHDDTIMRLLGLGGKAPASDDTPPDNGAIAPSEKAP